ncbi:uncharacterized protein LOC112146844 [Oryzias melastigma]|uniref:uncharacterized protein LOC112146844 n=1 Tax=Oryzias melastigma TaxID=30732 RepID=UPI000CF834D4|nr:uncharacterized protein LOC112146844 [Oryzias melastigma]
MDGPLEPYSWWELAWTPNPLCRAAVGVNTAVTKHVSRSIPDTGIGDSPRDQRWAKDGNPIPIRKSRTLASVANVIGSSCDTAAMCWGLFLRNGIVELESGRILLASVWEMSWTEPKTCWGTARFSSELRETGTLTSTPRTCGFAHITASTQENLFSQTLKGTFVASIPFCGSIWDTDCLPYYQCVSILAWPRGLCGAPQLHTGEARITEGHCPRGHATGGTLTDPAPLLLLWPLPLGALSKHSWKKALKHSPHFHLNFLEFTPPHPPLFPLFPSDTYNYHLLLPRFYSFVHCSSFSVFAFLYQRRLCHRNDDKSLHWSENRT